MRSCLIFNRCAIIILLVLVIPAPFAGANYSNEDYIWIEFDKKIKNIDDSITQPLSICYGQFPNKKGDFSKLEDVKAFCTFGEKNAEKEDIFYKLDVEMFEGKPSVKINSKQENWCMVVVSGKRREGGVEYNYSAKTSFFLFGKSKNLPLHKGISVNIDKRDMRFNIEIYRERIKELITYSRIRTFPIRARIVFDGNGFGKEDVSVINEFGEFQHFKTDKKGEFVYNLPRNRQDFSMKRRDRDFEQDLILTGHKTGNTVYMATCTVLFDFSFVNEGQYAHILWQGLAIFIILLALTLIFTLKLRKKFIFKS